MIRIFKRLILQHFCLVSVNLGMDNTFEFNWIYGKDYHNKTINHETHESIKLLLSLDENINK